MGLEGADAEFFRQLTSWPGRSTPESEDRRGCIKSSDGEGGLKKCGDMYPELAESAELAPSFCASLAAAASSCITLIASQVDASLEAVKMHRNGSLLWLRPAGSGLVMNGESQCKLFTSITVLRPVPVLRFNRLPGLLGEVLGGGVLDVAEAEAWAALILDSCSWTSSGLISGFWLTTWSPVRRLRGESHETGEWGLMGVVGIWICWVSSQPSPEARSAFELWLAASSLQKATILMTKN